VTLGAASCCWSRCHRRCGPPRTRCWRASPACTWNPASPTRRGGPGPRCGSAPGSGPGQIVIVDPATGMLLADEWLVTGPHGVYAPGTLTQYALWQSPGWTDRLP